MKSDTLKAEDRTQTGGADENTSDSTSPQTYQNKEIKAEGSENGAAAEEKLSPDEYPHGLRLVTLVGAVMMTVFLTSLDQTIVGTAIPKITDEFHGLSQVSWYGSAYFMCYGGFQSSWGKAYKFFPLKLTFMTSVLIFEVGSLICGVAPNSNALIAGRAIAALGGAGVTTGGTVIFAFCAEPKNRPMLMGLMGFSYTIAAILGPIIGGAFSERVTWRWCFYINLPLGGFSLTLIMLFFRTPSTAKVVTATFAEKIRQLDLVGITLAMGAIISYILALQYGGQAYPWKSSVVIGLLVGAFVIFVALAVWDYFQGDYAMLPRRLLGQRALWAPSIFQFFYSGCYFLLLYYLPIYFQSIKGVGAIQSGVDNLALVIAGCIAMLAGGMIVTSTRLATPFMVGGAALTTVGCGLLYTLDVNTASGKWIGYQILLGVSIAFPFQNGLNIAQAHITASDVSTATATLFFFQVVGGAFSLSAAQSAFVNRLTSTLPTYAPGVNPALVVATGATELRSVFPPDQLQGILLAYMEGIKASFAIATALSGVAFIMSFFCPWSRLPKGPAGGAAPAV
ncbi:MFS general substrate transporter [Cryphonectria parasitica EP155]|uniref:MFS general substrate transporter n=1 Tax=Cryphonectria parasitica (strain ATCC 38755 / EP155) TaxID=660469 RepID=A0A9P4YDT4_CRYP1|nr:MFS general substrate transporter [Cryphonectria parasitica EP155]KAF3771160.1 MFS general substrate transporter [Cryphonectria parasitica EP155]